MNTRTDSGRSTSPERPPSDPEDRYRQPTAIIDSHHPAVRAFARKAIPLCRTDADGTLAMIMRDRRRGAIGRAWTPCWDLQSRIKIGGKR
jgi:hypothetical protein